MDISFRFRIDTAMTKQGRTVYRVVIPAGGSVEDQILPWHYTVEEAHNDAREIARFMEENAAKYGSRDAWLRAIGRIE
jgi:hypothetical protein